MLFAVHHDLHGTLKADVAHIFCLFDGGHRIEDILLEDTITRIGIDGEVTHAKTGEVLEEVGALRGIDVVVLQACLYDDTGG